MSDAGQIGWVAFHERRKASGRIPRWPNETMVRILFGNDYLKTLVSLPSGGRVLDVGCGFGQNLLPFIDRDFDCVGVEIDPQIVKVAREIAAKRDLPVRFEQGQNQAVPFPDDSFDLVISIDTLHYEQTAENARMALREFARVLKPEGAVYISTIGPQHDMHARAEKLPDGRFRVQNYDFRDGELMYSFNTEQGLADALGETFSIVETARSTQHLMRSNLDFLLAVAQRKRR
jgi:ubiquinone/menaquinone biosynthesis C-methylase UbiE